MKIILLIGISVLSALSISCTAFVTRSCSSVPRKSSISELALSPVEAWTAYNEALEASPLLVKSATAGVILGMADLAGQALEAKQKGDERESSIDWARTGRFAFFGLVLQAPWNHFYYQFLDGALPPTEEPWTPTTGIKVVIDQFIQAPIFTVLIFAFLGALEGKSLEAIKKQLDEDYADTMFANWKLWVPATVLNIAFVPPILRVLYLNCVFFFWSIFLSLKLNKGEGEDITA
jgi:peroxisomal membrane protein 2